MWFDHGNCDFPGAHRGRWSFGPDVYGFVWGSGGRRRGGPRGGRMFEQGDLKYVILQMLAEKPRHGYEVIKELEERFGGTYAPSAGTVYPTLSLLEDLGYATVSPQEGGKKVYTITDEGRQYLDQNRSAVDDIFERIADLGASFISEGMMEINKAMAGLGKAIYAPASRYMRNSEKVAKVREILDRAAREIDAAVRESSL